ncbi:hypothetical protein JK629_14540 [Aequorivita iocasae]|uniref:Uncharacterized protein n=1 Tax=Aequorivita iocasae TaxID=2803865 RepID=A0ABX7DSJ5_9FLAO|nr:hypothetical protein JK629_14540 [Aequorivita iocasae]
MGVSYDAVSKYERDDIKHLRGSGQKDFQNALRVT